MKNKNENQQQETSLDDDVDREVGQMLEQAGQRPEIPESDFRIIKAAARVEWQELVESRQIRKGWWSLLSPIPAAAGILLVCALAWWWRTGGTVQPGIDAVATIELLSGDVWMEGPTGQRSNLAVGGPLPAGSELVTSDGPSSLLSIRLEDGKSIRLPAGSQARLSSTARIELLRGAVYVDSGPDSSGHSGIEVSTPFGSVFDIGTQFEVRLSQGQDELRVRVRSGSISLVRGQDEHLASIGEELSVRTDGMVSKGTYKPFGSDWDWILSAAPTLDIEGLPLREFLAWVASETGLEVRYEDQVLAGSAATIELHGDIDGLRPDEATIAVLPGTGLGHQVENGTLFIRRLPPGGGGV